MLPGKYSLPAHISHGAAHFGAAGGFRSWVPGYITDTLFGNLPRKLYLVLLAPASASAGFLLLGREPGKKQLGVTAGSSRRRGPGTVTKSRAVLGRRRRRSSPPPPGPPAGGDPGRPPPVPSSS